MDLEDSNLPPVYGSNIDVDYYFERGWGHPQRWCAEIVLISGPFQSLPVHSGPFVKTPYQII